MAVIIQLVPTIADACVAIPRMYDEHPRSDPNHSNWHGQPPKFTRSASCPVLRASDSWVLAAYLSVMFGMLGGGLGTVIFAKCATQSRDPDPLLTNFLPVLTELTSKQGPKGIIMGDYIIKLIMLSVICLMLGVGLRTSFGQVIEVAKDVQLVGRGLIANFIVVPGLIGLTLIWMPLAPHVKVGIMLMAAAPVAPMAPPFVAMAKGDVPYAVGLMTVVALLSIALTPAILVLAFPESLGEVVVDPLQIVRTLLSVQLIPIAAGMGLLHARPELAERVAGYVSKLGQIGLLVGVGLILFMQAKQILAIEPLAYLVMIVAVVVSLIVGDVMMFGEPAAQHRALAISTAIRNIALALLIANQSFAGTSAAPTTLIFAVITMILSIAYGKLMMPKEAGS